MNTFNVLMLGGSGFVGRHFKKKFDLFSNINLISPTSKQLDLRDESKTLDFFSFANKFLKKEKNPSLDLIIHLAAKTKAGDWCLHHKGEQWLDNQRINTNVLNGWRQSFPNTKLIAFGTSCGYPYESSTCEENEYLNGCPEPSLSAYAMTKRMLLVGLQSLNSQYAMNYVHFIPSTLCGTDFDKNDSHFIFDLIKKIVNAKRGGPVPVLWGNGYQYREIVNIKNAIEMVWNVMFSDDFKNESLNIGSSVCWSIRSYAQMICDIVGYNSNLIVYDESKYVGAYRKKLNIKKAQRLGLHRESNDVEENIRSMISYYESISNLSV
jgi:GDP-L-fucose synthase